MRVTNIRTERGGWNRYQPTPPALLGGGSTVANEPEQLLALRGGSAPYPPGFSCHLRTLSSFQRYAF